MEAGGSQLGSLMWWGCTHQPPARPPARHGAPARPQGSCCCPTMHPYALMLICRFKNVSLVSKRFRDLCRAPVLLRWLVVDISGARLLPRSRALLAFLTLHAQHVRVLSLGIHPPQIADAPTIAELGALVVGCLSACAAIGRLERLTLLGDTPLGSIAWLPALHRLQYLCLGGQGRTLQLPSGFSRLTELKHLEALGSVVRFDAPANLPPFLTFLLLMGNTGTLLPQQVRCPGTVHGRDC